MTKVLTVFGALGQQGSSIINSVLDDSQLSSAYSIRAVTRNPDSAQAKALAERVEVVHADNDDASSLEAALSGTHTVIVMTVPSFTPNGFDVELKAGKAIADAAVKAGAQYIIYSTLPSIKEMSHGKHTKVDHFESKAVGEQYIRALPIKSAFVSPGSFMENFSNKQLSFLFFGKNDKGWHLKGMGAPNSSWPLLAARNDIGKFVAAILADPSTYEGKTLYAATKMYTMEETARILSDASGRQITYERLSVEEFRNGLPFEQDRFAQLFATLGESGYYGPDSAHLVETSAAAAAAAGGKLTTLEEYLTENPIDLS